MLYSHLFVPVLLEIFTSMSRSAPKACARSQYTPMLAPEKWAVWSMNYKEQRRTAAVLELQMQYEI